MAKHFPSLGAYVAELEPPPGAALEPFAEAVDHQTAYGDADAFARSVVRVVPVG